MTEFLTTPGEPRGNLYYPFWPTLLSIYPLVTALALATGVAHAEPSSADIAQMMEAMQTRLSALEARNAELEKRLEGTRGESAIKTRVEELRKR